MSDWEVVMKAMNTFGALVGAASLAVLSAACNNTADGVRRDADENQRAAAQASEEARERADRAADRTADATDKAGDKVSEAARDTRDTVGTTGQQIGRSTDAAVQTMDVKSALMADKRVDASNINVDTDGDTKTVTLKGHVPNASQKSIAARIAEEKAVGYRIKNELMVR
jgi:hyperosmotically inducible protein